MERLQKVIANSGYTSRRKAEDLIVEGKVKVNGIIVKELGTKVTNKDVVEVNGKAISKVEKVYYVLLKFLLRHQYRMASHISEHQLLILSSLLFLLLYP